MMIDFIYKVSDALPYWASGERKTLNELAAITEVSVPHALQYLSEGLGKEIEIGGIFSYDEVKQAITSLRKRFKTQIEAREKEKTKKRDFAVAIYDRTMEKIHIMQAGGKWHQAFKTISYFAGQYEKDLPKDLLVTACSDAVRSGFKAKTNIQELGLWLQKAVSAAMSMHTQEGIEEALDLVDAYGELFLKEDSGKGPLLIGHILAILEEPAARNELWETFKRIVNQLYPATQENS